MGGFGDVIQAERKKKPNIEICYHKIQEGDSGDPSKFSLAQTHRVTFIPKDAAEGTPNQSNLCAKAASVDNWTTHAMVILWQVRWTLRGLQAIAPRVYLTKEVVLAPGTACQLSNTAAPK